MLAIIYNTCGIKGEHPEQYAEAIDRILNQEFNDFKLIVSSCLNTTQCGDYLKSRFGDRILINKIQEKLPVNVTFNHSCLLARDTYGEFEGYLYVDSGIFLKTPKDIGNLYTLFKSGDYGMVAAQVDSDGGYLDWFGLGKDNHDSSSNHLLFKDGDFIIPIGKTVNLHFQIFSKSIMDFYGYLFPDIYAGHCSESVFSFVCAAISNKFVLSKDVIVSHIQGMDGQSSGFDPHIWQRNGKPSYDHPFLVDSVVDIAKSGYKFGFGYEEIRHIVDHDPDKFDGYLAKDPNLKEFIRNTQYIGNTSLFEYSQISSEQL
jgi:hypothetical protein